MSFGGGLFGVVIDCSVCSANPFNLEPLLVLQYSLVIALLIYLIISLLSIPGTPHRKIFEFLVFLSYLKSFVFISLYFNWLLGRFSQFY